MKGLILSGGKGTRLYPLTYTRAKQLIPVANKPVLVRVIEAIRDAGIEDIGIVTGDTGPEIREALGNGERWGVNLTYIPQDAPMGLAHAVKISRDFLGNDRFVMFLGDNVIQGGINDLIRQFGTSDWNSQIVLTEVEEPQHYGVAELSPEGQILRLVEKPREPQSNLALVGIYMFDHHIHEACEAIKPSWRGELEITDAIQWLIDNGHRVRHEVLHGWWLDTGKLTPLLEANRLILEVLEPSHHGKVDEHSQLDGRVWVAEGAEIVRSTIRGPVAIGANTRIIDSYIGPFSSVDADCEIIGSELEHSIVLANSRVENVPRVIDSLIGRHAVVQRTHQRPKANRFLVGDHCQIDLDS